MSTVTAWHFVGERLADGRQVPADGKWIKPLPTAVADGGHLCAYRDPFDALRNAEGSTLCRVECEIAETRDEHLFCARRKILARVDATGLLRKFARECAQSVVHLWAAPDVMRKFLETGNQDKARAARNAAKCVVVPIGRAQHAALAAMLAASNYASTPSAVLRIVYHATSALGTEQVPELIYYARFQSLVREAFNLQETEA